MCLHWAGRQAGRQAGADGQGQAGKARQGRCGQAPDARPGVDGVEQGLDAWWVSGQGEQMWRAAREDKERPHATHSRLFRIHGMPGRLGRANKEEQRHVCVLACPKCEGRVAQGEG